MFHFVRHLVEMFLAMMAGMMVGAFLLATAVGTTVSEARREHAVAWVVVMAFDMTVPMVAVMLYRGHSLRSAGEMAAAMIIPSLPIVACQMSHVVSGVTGWAQVHGLRGKTSLSERVEWDNFYIENWSLWLDVKILLMTCWAVLSYFAKAE